MLSIVGTLYCSAPYLEAFVSRALAAAAGVPGEVEVVLVNDGSPDDSLAIAKGLADRHPEVRVVDLARNFGHHRAMMCALEHARGDHVFLIDVDLEEAPELLPVFWQRMQEERDVDVVFGQLRRRRGGWYPRTSGRLYYTLIRHLGEVPLAPNLATVRLMTRRYVDALLQYREREMFMAGLWHDAGFRQVAVPIDKGDKGETSYSLGRKLSLVVNSVTAFSAKPLRMIFYTGLVISFAGSLFALYLAWRRLFHGIPVDGWTSMMVSIWFIGGLMILFLGIIGIYLSKIFIEVKQRPYTTVREIYRGDRDA
jgi:putative glycosyltransferase